MPFSLSPWLLDEAADFVNKSASGNVSVQLATVKAGQIITKMTALGLRCAHRYG